MRPLKEEWSYPVPKIHRRWLRLTLGLPFIALMLPFVLAGYLLSGLLTTVDYCIKDVQEVLLATWKGEGGA